MSTVNPNHLSTDTTTFRTPVSRRAVRIGRGLSALSILFLAFDSLGKLTEAAPVVAGTARLGYPASITFTLGVILSLCVAAYAIPGSSLLGAVLLTGYLGGAVAAQARVENPLLSHTLFPVYVGVLLWGGLFLREARLRAFFPWRSGR